MTDTLASPYTGTGSVIRDFPRMADFEVAVKRLLPFVSNPETFLDTLVLVGSSDAEELSDPQIVPSVGYAFANASRDRTNCAYARELFAHVESLTHTLRRHGGRGRKEEFNVDVPAMLGRVYHEVTGVFEPVVQIPAGKKL